MAFFTSFLISLAVSLVSAVLFKPKPKKQSNTVQRAGVNEPLSRVYGKRRVAMVITDSVTDYNTYEPRDYVTNPADTYLPAQDMLSTTRTNWERRTNLYMQGPLCVSGRLNGPLTNTDFNDLNVRVDDKTFNDSKLISADNVQNTGTTAVVYKKGNVPDTLANIVPNIGNLSDKWANMVHVHTLAWMTIVAKLTFNGLPKFTFDVKSNFLYDPREGPDSLTPNVVDNRTTWTGRNDNPGLQLLDYMLDTVFGLGEKVESIDLDSFRLMANIADVPVSVNAETTVTRFSNTTIEDILQGLRDEGYFAAFPEIFGNPTLYQTEQTQTVSSKPFLRSNILLDTSDTVSENIEQLLFACRDARLVKSRLGKWKILPAWLLSRHVNVQTITDVTGAGPFQMFWAVDVTRVDSVLVNDNPVGIVSITTDDSTFSNSVKNITFTTANFIALSGELVINFSGTAPLAVDGAKYSLDTRNNGVPTARLDFLASTTNPVVSGSTWTYTGSYLRNPSTDQAYSDANGALKENPNVDTVLRSGITIDTSVTETDVITINYVDNAIPGLPLAGHIMRTPEDLGWDYDVITDPEDEVTPILRILGGGDYASVSTDDRLNQVTVRFPDEFTEFKTNDIVWPENNSTKHLEFLDADNNKILTRTIELNSVTDKASAYDLAEYTVRRSRSQDAVDYTLTPGALILEPNDIVKVTDSQLNINNPADDFATLASYFTVVSITTNPDFTVKVSLLRYEPEDYTHLIPEYEEFKQEILSPEPRVEEAFKGQITAQASENPVIITDANGALEYNASGWELSFLYSGLPATVSNGSVAADNDLAVGTWYVKSATQANLVFDANDPGAPVTNFLTYNTGNDTVEIDPIASFATGQINGRITLEVVYKIASNSFVTSRVQVSYIANRTEYLPVGGTTNQVLIKVDNTDFNVAWGTIATTSAGSSNLDGGDASTDPNSATTIDGGTAGSTATDTYNGGDASTIFTTNAIIDGGSAGG